MSIKTVNTTEASKRPFVGRDDLRTLFKETVEKKNKKIIKPDQHKVLVFYGVAGIGKSRLQQQLAEDLKEIWKAAVCITLDFDRGLHQIAEDGLPYIRWTLNNDEYKIPFPIFDLAFALYWRKNKPHIALTKKIPPWWDEAGLASDVAALVSEVPGLSLITKTAQIVARRYQSFRDWWTKHKEETLRRLAGIQAKNIEDLLPMFLAMDIKSYLQEFPVPIVFFLETYEMLFGEERKEDILSTRDDWVKTLVANLPQALWVITGREKLLWAKDNKEWDDHLEHHEIFGLEEKHAGKFLEKCGIDNNEIREVIITGSKEEGDKCVPYYLNLSVDTYLTIHEERKPVADDFGTTPREIFLSFIRHLNKPEVETLKLLSAARNWDDELAKALFNQFRTDHTLAAPPDLYGFSFIKEGPAPGRRRMHDLMRQSLQEHQDKNLRKKVHQFLFTHYDNQLEEIDIKSITDTHKTALTEAFYHAGVIKRPDKLAGWVGERTKVFKNAAQWAILVPFYEELIVVLENGTASNQPNLATALNELALSYKAQAKYAEAEPLYKRALVIDEKALGKDHPDVATDLNNLAELYRVTGRYGVAEPLYKRALVIDEKALGKDHPNVATDLNNLAELYRVTGSYGEAEPLFKRALVIDEKALGKDHHDVATDLNNLAELYRVTGRYSEAEPLYKRALAIYEKALGKDHPDVATNQNNLAALYDDQGRYGEAEPLYKRALDIWEKRLGKEHPNVGSSLNNLALLCYTQGRYAEAEPLYRRALAIDEKALGKDHPGVATDLNNLAGLYRATDRYAEAEPLYKRALAILEKTLPPDHPNLATVMENMADLYRETGRNKEAEKLEERAREIRERRTQQEGGR